MNNDLYTNYAPVTNMDVYTSADIVSTRFDDFTRALDSLSNVINSVTTPAGNTVTDRLSFNANDNIRGRRAQYVTFDDSMWDSSLWTITIPSKDDGAEEPGEVCPIAEEDLRDVLNT